MQAAVLTRAGKVEGELGVRLLARTVEKIAFDLPVWVGRFR